MKTWTTTTTTSGCSTFSLLFMWTFCCLCVMNVNVSPEVKSILYNKLPLKDALQLRAASREWKTIFLRSKYILNIQEKRWISIHHAAHVLGITEDDYQKTVICHLHPSMTEVTCSIVGGYYNGELISLDLKVQEDCLTMQFTDEFADLQFLKSGTPKCIEKLHGKKLSSKEFMDFAEAWARAVNSPFIKLEDAAQVVNGKVVLSYFKFFERGKMFYESFGYTPCEETLENYNVTIKTLKTLANSTLVDVEKMSAYDFLAQQYYTSFISNLEKAETTFNQYMTKPLSKQSTTIKEIYMALTNGATSLCTRQALEVTKTYPSDTLAKYSALCRMTNDLSQLISRLIELAYKEEKLDSVYVSYCKNLKDDVNGKFIKRASKV